MKNKSLFFCLDVFKAYVNFEMSNADVPGNNGNIRNMIKDHVCHDLFIFYF